MKPVFSNMAACLQMLDMNPKLTQVDTNQMDTSSTARGEGKKKPHTGHNNRGDKEDVKLYAASGYL